jgi:hypothetical protein
VPTALAAVTAGKTLSGLPAVNYTRGLIINRVLFKDAGLNPDSPPTTWAQVEQDARAITKLGHITVANLPILHLNLIGSSTGNAERRYLRSASTTPQNLVLVASAMAAVPTLIFFLVFQRNILSGLAAGSLKD